MFTILLWTTQELPEQMHSSLEGKVKFAFEFRKIFPHINCRLVYNLQYNDILMYGMLYICNTLPYGCLSTPSGTRHRTKCLYIFECDINHISFSRRSLIFLEVLKTTVSLFVSLCRFNCSGNYLLRLFFVQPSRL